MCGVTGFWSGAPIAASEMDGLLRAMNAAIRHRGPDDTGRWTSSEHGVGLGHQRLSIVDLSPQGHQPMRSASGRFVMVFNGEVYNHERLRVALADAGHSPAFRGTSDTEVMLACFDAWGVEASLDKFIGMFAMAVWDSERRALHLIRDRLGIKPLYYGKVADKLVFASELHAFRALPGFGAALSRPALAAYVELGRVPGSQSVYEGVYKVEPGTMRTFVRPEGRGEPTVYWSAWEVGLAASRAPRVDERSELEALEVLLKDAVALRMVADVPVGAFLSGGIDSSLVVALAQEQSARAVRTFSIGFDDRASDESAAARAVASHLGTQHTEFILRDGDALEIVPQLATIYDEPFADSSQIPTFAVSRLARNEVVVALSGDGGDELFCGYDHYARDHRLLELSRRVPRHLADVAGSLAAQLGSGESRVARNVRRIGRLLRGRDDRQRYRALQGHWTHRSSIIVGAESPDDSAFGADAPDSWRAMMWADATQYLPDDILTKVDRASMAVALEVRVPLLDHRVFAHSCRFGIDALRDQRQGKLPLRKLLYRRVPRALVERTKHGFSIPLSKWLRGPLRAWTGDLLESLSATGLVDRTSIKRVWSLHEKGTLDSSALVWTLAMLAQWLAAGRDSRVD